MEYTKLAERVKAKLAERLHVQHIGETPAPSIEGIDEAAQQITDIIVEMMSNGNNELPMSFDEFCSQSANETTVPVVFVEPTMSAEEHSAIMGSELLVDEPASLSPLTPVTTTDTTDTVTVDAPAPDAEDVAPKSWWEENQSATPTVCLTGPQDAPSAFEIVEQTESSLAKTELVTESTDTFYETAMRVLVNDDPYLMFVKQRRMHENAELSDSSCLRLIYKDYVRDDATYQARLKSIKSA